MEILVPSFALFIVFAPSSLPKSSLIHIIAILPYLLRKSTNQWAYNLFQVCGEIEVASQSRVPQKGHIERKWEYLIVDGALWSGSLEEKILGIKVNFSSTV